MYTYRLIEVHSSVVVIKECVITAASINYMTFGLRRSSLAVTHIMNTIVNDSLFYQ